MSSPFSTIEEFKGAIDGPTGGAIYTFAKTPIINHIALVVAVGIFVLFIVNTYITPAEPGVEHSAENGVDKSLKHLSLFIVAGLLSFVAAGHRYASRPEANAERTAQNMPQMRSYQTASRRLPLGLLGMMGVGLPTFRQMVGKKAGKRRKRSLRGRSSHGYKPRP